MPDAIFEEPRLARVYDPLDPDRGDLVVYAAIAEEFGARSVLDIGCGTGTFACMLAARGLTVTGLDPAAASLEVARAKPGDPAASIAVIQPRAADSIAATFGTTSARLLISAVPASIATVLPISSCGSGVVAAPARIGCATASRAVAGRWTAGPGARSS